MHDDGRTGGPLHQRAHPAQSARHASASAQLAAGAPEPDTAAAQKNEAEQEAAAAAAAEEPEEPEEPEEEYYTVQRGDNLWNIARKNGTSVSALKRLNNISGDRLRPGQRLRVR